MLYFVLAGVLLLLLIGLLLFFDRDKNKEDKLPIHEQLGKLYRKYFLPYSKVKLVPIFIVKLVIFVATFLFCVAATYTNIVLADKDIFGKYDYRLNISYDNELETIEEQEAALAIDVELVNYLIETYTWDEVYLFGRSDLAFTMELYLENNNIEVLEDIELVSTRVYNRVYDYFEVRDRDFMLYGLISLAVSFVTEVYLWAGSSLIRNAERKNLYFLKKILVLNGSLKPADISIVLKEMIDRATPFNRRDLEKIQESLKDINQDTSSIIIEISRSKKDLFEKMFYEKLNMAATINFDDAVDSIKQELKYDRQKTRREFTKTASDISITAVVLLTILLAIATLYMLIPWMSSLDMTQIIE